MVKRWADWSPGIRWLAGIAAVVLAAAIVWALFVPLGSDKRDVRIGGIYGLERIARDSAKDHPTVMEVLTAFIREHSHEPWPPLDTSDPGQERSTRPDVQAAVTVVGPRDAKRDILPIDFAGANFIGANLAGANFVHARLTQATSQTRTSPARTSPTSTSPSTSPTRTSPARTSLAQISPTRTSATRTSAAQTSPAPDGRKEREFRTAG